MKKYNKTAFIVLIIALLPTFVVSAESLKEQYNVFEMINKYFANSPEAENIKLNNQKQLLDNYISEKALLDIERQIEVTTEKIDDYSLGRLSSNDAANIRDYQDAEDNSRINLYELKMKRELYIIQNELDKFNEKYSEKILMSQENSLEYTVYKLLWDICVLEDKLQYMEFSKKLFELDLEVKKNQFKIGYTSEIDVLNCEAELKKMNYELVLTKNELDILKQKYSLNSKQSAELYITRFSEDGTYEVKKQLDSFETDNYTLLYINKQIEVYSSYTEKLNILYDEFKPNGNVYYHRSNSMSDINKDYYNETLENLTDEIAYYENETEILKNSMEIYKNNLTLYVYQTCGNLDALNVKRTASLASLDADTKQLEISKKMYEIGRINESALIEAEINLYKSKYELSQIEAEIMCLKFILNNKIENF